MTKKKENIPETAPQIFGTMYIRPSSVFQITLKVKESMENFEGSIALVLSRFSLVYHDSICQGRKPAFSLIFDLRPSLSCIWNTASFKVDFLYHVHRDMYKFSWL